MKIHRAKTSWQDSLQELITMWEESGLCESVQSNERCTWANELGDVLLYEHDRLTNLSVDWELGLFANEVYSGPKSTPWIYWPRHPRKLEACINEGIWNYDQRDISSSFLGKVENPSQHQKRTKKHNTHSYTFSTKGFRFKTQPNNANTRSLCFRSHEKILLQRIQ